MQNNLATLEFGRNINPSRTQNSLQFSSVVKGVGCQGHTLLTKVRWVTALKTDLLKFPRVRARAKTTRAKIEFIRRLSEI